LEAAALRRQGRKCRILAEIRGKGRGALNVHHRAGGHASPEFSNLSYRIGLGYQRELPLGVTAYIQPDLVLGDYVAASPSFGTTRRDRLVRVQLAVTKRDIRIYGFSPSFTYNFADNISNQPLFAYTRHQILIGFSRAF
jgi:hypothetical protein